MNASSVHLSASRISLNAHVISPIHDVLCNQCNTIVIQVIGESLVIKDRHHSQQHTTILSIRDLYESYVNRLN